MQAAMGSLSNISIASLKNSIDEVRAQVYPRNETERKVMAFLTIPTETLLRASDDPIIFYT